MPIPTNLILSVPGPPAAALETSQSLDAVEGACRGCLASDPFTDQHGLDDRPHSCAGAGGPGRCRSDHEPVQADSTFGLQRFPANPRLQSPNRSAGDCSQIPASSVNQSPLVLVFRCPSSSMC